MDEYKTLRVMNQNDCEKWINGKKKWSDFPLYDPAIKEDFDNMKDEIQRVKKMLIDTKELDSIKKENKELKDAIAEMNQDQKDLIAIVNKKQKVIQ